MKLGIVEEGKLAGKKIILEPRTGLSKSVYLVEGQPPLGGAPIFYKTCLIHERAIPDNGCPDCGAKG